MCEAEAVFEQHFLSIFSHDNIFTPPNSKLMSQTTLHTNQIPKLKGSRRVGFHSCQCSNDIRKGRYSLKVGLDIWVIREIDVRVLSPAQVDVQVTVSHSKGVTHKEALGSDEGIVQKLELLFDCVSTVSLHFFGF
jgi:hypothetical protein